MKRFALAILTTVISLAAHSAYDVQVKLAKSGTTIVDGRLRIAEGSEGSIINKDSTGDSASSFIEVVPTKHANGISLTVVTGHMDSDGTRNVVAKSELVLASGKTATVNVGNLSNPSEEVTLTISPRIVPDQKN